jgi:hypothetical protein
MNVAIRLLNDAYMQINNETIEVSKPSFFLNVFDEAMIAFFTNNVNDDKVDSDITSTQIDVPDKEKLLIRNNFDNSPVMNGKLDFNHWDAKSSKLNGGKMTNGIHKSNKVNSPKTLKEQLYNGSESNHQTMRVQGTVQTRPKPSTRKYQLSEIPQVVIDTAINIILVILHKAVPDSAKVRNDARVLLRRIIRSGKVSARSHLTFIPTSSYDDVPAVTNFKHILKSLELSCSENEIGQVWSAYTPFDFICDMMQHCSDVSESQMVIATQYTLFNTHPIDIASYFVRNKNLTDCDILRKQGTHLMSLHNKNKDEFEHDHALVKHKMVVSGTAYLINRITKYSIAFNISLLRNAIENELNLPEIQILLQLVIHMISTPERAKVYPPPSFSMKNLIQLIGTLCDCLQSYDNQMEHGRKIVLEQIKDSLSTISSATGKVLSLQKLLQESIECIVGNDLSAEQSKVEIESNQNKEQTTTIDRKKSVTTALPPYQIERLLL